MWRKINTTKALTYIKFTIFLRGNRNHKFDFSKPGDLTSDYLAFRQHRTTDPNGTEKNNFLLYPKDLIVASLIELLLNFFSLMIISITWYCIM